MSLALFAPDRAEDEADLRLKIFRRESSLSLSRILPHLSLLGVSVIDERPYELSMSNGEKAFIYDFGLTVPGGAEAVRQELDPGGPAAVHGRVHRLLHRAERVRRLQRAGDDRRPGLAGGQRAPRHRALPPAGRRHLQPDLPGPGAEHQRGPDPQARGALRDQVRSRARDRPRDPEDPDGGADRDDPGPPERCRQPGPRPHHPLLPGRHPGDDPHQLLRLGPSGDRAQDAAPADPGPARAAAGVRDLRLLPPRRGRPPAVRSGGAGRAALVGPGGGLPDRGARSGQGADGEERGDRARSGPRAASIPSSCPTSRSTGRPGWPRARPATRSSSPACWT